MDSSLQPRIHRPLRFAAGASMLLLVAAPMLVPVAFAQETCDAFGPWMACKSGSSPRCANTPVPGGRPRETQLSARCPEGERTTAPIVAAQLLAALMAASVAGVLVVQSLRPSQSSRVVKRLNGSSP